MLLNLKQNVFYIILNLLNQLADKSLSKFCGTRIILKAIKLALYFFNHLILHHDRFRIKIGLRDASKFMEMWHDFQLGKLIDKFVTLF